jgi:hypothetical protein
MPYGCDHLGEKDTGHDQLGKVHPVPVVHPGV